MSVSEVRLQVPESPLIDEKGEKVTRTVKQRHVVRVGEWGAGQSTNEKQQPIEQ